MRPNTLHTQFPKGRATLQYLVRLMSRSNKDSRPSFFYLMCRYARSDRPADREHPRQFADSQGRDTPSRRFTHRRLLRWLTRASRCNIVTHFSPHPTHQHTHKRTEAREKSEHGQHDPEAE